MKKLFLGIFISLGAIFLMSHNASAVSETFYLKNGIYAYGIPTVSGSQGGNSVNVQSGQNFNVQNNIYSLPQTKFWYSMAFKFKSDNTNVDLSKYTDYTFTFTYCSEAAYFSPTSNDYFRLTDYAEYDVYDYDTISGASGTVWGSDILHLHQANKCSNVILKGKNGIATSTNAFQLGTTNNGSFTRMFGYDPAGLDGVTNTYLYIISPTVVFYDNPNEADNAIQKEKENIQNAANNSQTSGNQSQTSSQGATSSLLSVFSGFANVITNASATNCVINAPLNTAFSNDRLNVDLCGLSIPPAIGALTSIIAVMVVVPFALSMFNKFIGIMQGFQR